MPFKDSTWFFLHLTSQVDWRLPKKKSYRDWSTWTHGNNPLVVFFTHSARHGALRKSTTRLSWTPHYSTPINIYLSSSIFAATWSPAIGAQCKIGSIYLLSRYETRLWILSGRPMAIVSTLCTNRHTHLTTCATAWCTTMWLFFSCCCCLPINQSRSSRDAFEPNMQLWSDLWAKSARRLAIAIMWRAHEIYRDMRAYVALRSALNHWSRFTFQTPRSIRWEGEDCGSSGWADQLPCRVNMEWISNNMKVPPICIIWLIGDLLEIITYVVERFLNIMLIYCICIK